MHHGRRCFTHTKAAFDCRCAERRAGRPEEDLSEDEDLALKRMFADPKKGLTKQELPGLYKKPGAARGGEGGAGPKHPASSMHLPAGKPRAPVARPLKRKALPGRLRKKLAAQAGRGH